MSAYPPGPQAVRRAAEALRQRQAEQAACSHPAFMFNRGILGGPAFYCVKCGAPKPAQ